MTATPAIDAAVASTSLPVLQSSSLTLDFELLAKSHWKDFEDGAAGSGPGYGNGYAFGHSKDDDEDDDDGDDHGGGDGGGFGGFIGDFLANNQATVLAVTALIPVFNLGPVAVGNSLLANAYYSGYEGSATGIEGVISYVNSQLAAADTDLVKTIVLGLTSLIPQFNIGPVAVGNSLLATAFFDGYNGSATGLPGVISYVTSQLGVQQPAPASSVAADETPSGAAVKVSAAAVPAVSNPEPAVAVERVDAAGATFAAVAAAAAESRADDGARGKARGAGDTAATADAQRSSRSSAVATGESAGSAKAGAVRSAARSGGADD